MRIRGKYGPALAAAALSLALFAAASRLIELDQGTWRYLTAICALLLLYGAAMAARRIELSESTIEIRDLWERQSVPLAEISHVFLATQRGGKFWAPWLLFFNITDLTEQKREWARGSADLFRATLSMSVAGALADYNSFVERNGIIGMKLLGLMRSDLFDARQLAGLLDEIKRRKPSVVFDERLTRILSESA